MLEVLKAINEQMQALNLQYYDIINNSSKVTYPYLTGELSQSLFDVETGRNEADLLIDLWTRNERLEIVKINEQLKAHFSNLDVVKDGIYIHFDYGSCTPVATNDYTLKRLQVIISIVWWKGE